MPDRNAVFHCGLFRPEFVNRLDAILTFQPLTPAIVERIVEVPQVQVVDRVVEVPQIQEIVREVPKIVTQLAALHADDVALDVENGRHVQLEDFELLPDEVLVNQIPVEGYATASEGGYTVAVATEITPELQREGVARELVHHIQNLRKDAGFDVDSNAAVLVDAEGRTELALQSKRELARRILDRVAAGLVTVVGGTVDAPEAHEEA